MPHSTRVSRRDLLAGAAGTLAFATSGRAVAQAGKPNIVFILADDMGYADVSCYGRPDLSTPNIDRIAANGVRFLQAYANSAVCSATRTALITGRYQYRLRLGLEEPLGPNPNVGLPPEHPTLPSLLKKAGYGTTLIGKWHMGLLPKFGPLKSGYDFAAAGTAPDPAFPPDGMNLLPALTQNAAPIPRKFFWRYKANWQRAVRDGDFKYLKILDNTFLFNVVADPMERANLKVRNKDIYDRLVAEWNDWNATMLPEVAESGTGNFSGDQLADHIGTQKVSGAPDPELPTTTPAAQVR
jgi:arylsulfatase A-like enzyme